MTSLWRHKSARPRKFGYIENDRENYKNQFFAKNRRNMRFSQDFWLNMYENYDSNLQSKFEAHILSNI